MISLPNPMSTVEELRPVAQTTTQWLQQLPQNVLSKVNELSRDQGYPLHDIREFIEEFGYNNFISGYYETWADLTNHYDDEAIRAFVDEYNIREIEYFEDAYFGQYGTISAFVAEWIEGQGDEVAPYIVVDYEATWERNLQFNFDFVDGYVFLNNY